MSDDRRRFALRENGEETSVFKGNAPRQAALKAARRLDSAENKEEAMSDTERIRLREHGTNKIHIYDTWTWEETAPDNSPAWIEDSVTKANVSKTRVEDCSALDDVLNPDQSNSPTFGEQLNITQEKCKNCHHSLDKLKIAVPVRDVTEPQVIRYNRHHYTCENCQKEVVADHQDCPSTGGFGVNLLAQTVLFHFEYRIPYNKLLELLRQLYGINTSNKTLLDICERMMSEARHEYDEIQTRIQSSEILYVDETSHYVKGENKWLWAFTTKERTLYVLRDTRGSEVLNEILTQDFSGIIVCDGHRAYPAFHSRLQRCWGHLLRGTDQLSDDDDEAWEIYNNLFDIFEGLKSFLETDPSLLQRLVVARDAQRELRRLTATDVESEDAIEVLTMLENGLGNWLTFVEYPEVEPTNNRAETVLREPIKIRRIIGQLQNEKGMRLHETFLSLLRTWKQQDKNPYSELQRLAQKV